jgi:hypothetical protein
MVYDFTVIYIKCQILFSESISWHQTSKDEIERGPPLILPSVWKRNTQLEIKFTKPWRINEVYVIDVMLAQSNREDYSKVPREITKEDRAKSNYKMKN